MKTNEYTFKENESINLGEIKKFYNDNLIISNFVYTEPIDMPSYNVKTTLYRNSYNPYKDPEVPHYFKAEKNVNCMHYANNAEITEFTDETDKAKQLSVKVINGMQNMIITRMFQFGNMNYDKLVSYKHIKSFGIVGSEDIPERIKDNIKRAGTYFRRLYRVLKPVKVDYIVTNKRISEILMKSKYFTACKVKQDPEISLKHIGKFYGVDLYRDDSMFENVNSVMIGHKGMHKDFGIHFYPYTLFEYDKDINQVKAKAATTDNGDYPEISYLTFNVIF